jgi:hypothetical protein
MSSITMHGKSSLFLSRHGKSSRASLSEFFNFQPNSSSKSLQQPNLLRPSPHLQQGDPSGSGLSISVRPNRQTTRARSSGRRKRIDLGGPNRLRRTDPSVPLVLPLTYPVHPASGAKSTSPLPQTFARFLRRHPQAAPSSTLLVAIGVSSSMCRGS